MKMLKPQNILIFICFTMLTFHLFTALAGAAVPQIVKATSFASSVEPAAKDTTLWQTLVAGGSVMIIIAILSIIALAIIIFGDHPFSYPVCALGRCVRCAV